MMSAIPFKILNDRYVVLKQHTINEFFKFLINYIVGQIDLLIISMNLQWSYF